MNGKTLSILVFFLFIGMILLPISLATEKEAGVSDDKEPIDIGLIYTGIITSKKWKEEGYDGYTFVKPILVTDGFYLFTKRNCAGIGIPDKDLRIHAFFILRTGEVMDGGIIL